MNTTMMRLMFLTAMAIVLGSTAMRPIHAAQTDQTAVVGAYIGTVATQLHLRPETAIDLSDGSGVYCFDTGLERGGRMACYAVDPEATRKDVLDFINADPLIEAGLNAEDLPRLPAERDTMRSGQWYFVPTGDLEPHHNKRFRFPVLVRAVNLPVHEDEWIVG